MSSSGRERKKKRQGERMETPAGFIYKEKGISGRRENRGATRFGSGAAALGIADLLIKEVVINVNFMMTSCRFTATRDDDDMAVYQLPEDVEDRFL